MIRKKKLYARPMKPFEAVRIQEENVLKGKYGLKNKREIWKALAKINYFRKRAMTLARASGEEQEVFFNKLRAIGLKVDSISDVLDLQVEDLLKRRLPSIIAERKLANTIKQARQMVVHKKVIVGDRANSSPGYIVRVDEEDKIRIKEKKPKIKSEEAVKEEKLEESPQEDTQKAAEVSS